MRTRKLTAAILAAAMSGSVLAMAPSDLIRAAQLPVKIDESVFPDAKLRAVLSETLYDKDGNGTLDAEELSKLTELYCGDKDIKTLKGIENFTNLEMLMCFDNDLTSIDISKNTKLKKLECNGNNIGFIDISNCPELVTLVTDTSAHEITIGHSQCTWYYTDTHSLIFDKTTDLYTQPAVMIDADHFPDANFRTCVAAYDNDSNGWLNNAELTSVKEMNVSDNGIKDLTGIGYFTELRKLETQWNDLQTIDLKDNTKLTYLDCAASHIKSLDVSMLPELTYLDCGTNELTYIDLSNNKKLGEFQGQKNGFDHIEIMSCPNLIKAVTEAAPFIDEEIQIYQTSEFRFVCDSDVKIVNGILINETNFPDVNFRNFVALSSIDQNSDTVLTQTELDAVKNINVRGKEIEDLKGIEFFTNLEVLVCSENSLTSLSLEKNTKLKALDCSGNLLEELDVTYLGNLMQFFCNDNNLRSLNVSNMPELVYLVCYNNNLTDLKITNDTNLQQLTCAYNPLTLVDVQGCPKIIEAVNYGERSIYEDIMVYVGSDALIQAGTNTLFYDTVIPTKIDIYNFPDDNFRKFISENIDGNNSGYLEKHEIENTKELDISNKAIMSLIGIEYFTELERLNCSENILKSINLKDNKKLTYLDCANSMVENLTVTDNKALKELYCERNLLTTLDVSNLDKLENLACLSNKLTSLNIKNDTSLYALTCIFNDIPYIEIQTCPLLVELVNGTEAIEYDSYYSVKSGGKSLMYDLNTDILQAAPTATPEPTSTATPEPTATATPSPEPTVTATPSPEPTATATPAPTVTATPTATVAPTVSATPTVTPTAAPTGVTAATATPTVTPTATLEPTATETPVPTVTATPEPTTAPSGPNSQIIDFVNRIYTFVLDREPEKDGAEFWSNELYTFSRTGAEVAQGFIFSPEFVARNTNDEQFVTILYKTFFGRDPEEGGMKYWLEQLSTGAMDRTTVANGFIFSQEWADTCASYGIRSGGDIKPNGTIEPTELTYAFVERMYTTAMGRGYDEGGRQYWASLLANFEITGEQVGASFFLSDEMVSYNLTDAEFINRLYLTFMNREADEAGAAYWLGVMSTGTQRGDIVLGFTRSPEFTQKCVEARILPY